MQEIGYCSRCRTFTENTECQICRNAERDAGVLCVVGFPSDVAAIERSTAFNGQYFVLLGHLSPLDGVGPEQLGIALLEDRLSKGSVKELILATNATVEGEATAHFIGELAKRHGVKVMRIAHGVPLGGELEFVDQGTLSHAFSGRVEV